MTIKRKTIRKFMQKEMRKRLFDETRVSRNELCVAYVDFTGRNAYSDDSFILDKKIEFINAIQEYCKGFVDFHVTSYGTYEANFLVDPVDTTAWNEAMDSIYKEADHE